MRPKKKPASPGARGRMIMIACIALAVLLFILLAVVLVRGLKNRTDAQSSTPQASSLYVPPAQTYSVPEAQSQPEDYPPEAEETSLPEQSSAPEPESAASSSLPPQPAPQFTETPSVKLEGSTLTVTYKTDTDATVNAILATSGDKISTTVFYDYYNRNVAYKPAVAKKTTYNVGTSGKSESFTLPDLGKDYYLLINAAENLTNTWQSYVTVVKVYTAPETDATFVSVPSLNDVSGEEIRYTFTTKGNSTLYVLVTAFGSPAPTAKQIREGGTGYTGTQHGMFSASGKAGAESTLIIPRAKLPNAVYEVWFVAQDANGTFSAVVYDTMTLK